MRRRLCSPKDSLPRKVSGSEERGETTVFAGYQNNRFLKFISFILSPHINPRQSWILDSTPWIPDSRYFIPVFVSGTWILDSNPLWNSGFLELYSGFQSPGFRIPQVKFSRFPDSTSKYFTDSGIQSIEETLNSIPGVRSCHVLCRRC